MSLIRGCLVLSVPLVIAQLFIGNEVCRSNCRNKKENNRAHDQHSRIRFCDEAKVIAQRELSNPACKLSQLPVKAGLRFSKKAVVPSL